MTTESLTSEYLLSLERASAFLGLPSLVLADMATQGSGPTCIRLGAEMLFRLPDLDQFLKPARA